MANKNHDKHLNFEAFRDNVRSLTESKGMLGKDLAYAIKATPATISRYMTGLRDPDLDYVYRISQYFGVSIDWLLGTADDKLEVLTPDIRRVMELYSRASTEDQAVIKTVLRKYDVPEQETE